MKSLVKGENILNTADKRCFFTFVMAAPTLEGVFFFSFYTSSKIKESLS